MNTVTIRIPATIDAAITPNRIPRTRGGMYKRRAIAQELKNTTMLAVRTQYLDVYPDAPWRLDYVVAWGKRRKRMDDDNLKASLKYVQDGIADETGVNDKHMTIGEVEQVRDPEGLGFIEVVIRSAEGVAA